MGPHLSLPALAHVVDFLLWPWSSPVMWNSQAPVTRWTIYRLWVVSKGWPQAPSPAHWVSALFNPGLAPWRRCWWALAKSDLTAVTAWASTQWAGQVAEMWSHLLEVLPPTRTWPRVNLSAESFTSQSFFTFASLTVYINISRDSWGRFLPGNVSIAPRGTSQAVTDSAWAKRGALCQPQDKA